MLRFSASVLGLFVGLALALPTSPARAQSEGFDPWAGVEEMIVSGAGGGAALAQSTSTTVTAFDALELDRRGIEGIDTLGLNVPNLFISKNGASPIVTIRGIGSTSGGISADEAVAVHVDGVFMKRPLFLSAEFFDLEDLQVARGPQGFRGGKNANGGSLNFVSRKPADEFGAEATATFGNYGQKRVTGFVNVPITEMLATRLAFYHEKRDPYAELTGILEGRFEEEAGDDAANLGFRSHTLFSPTEDFEILISGNYFEQKGAGPAVTLAGELSAAQLSLGVTPLSSDPRQVSLNRAPKQNNKIFGGSMTVSWALPAPKGVDVLDLKMIGAWERVQRSDKRDGDLTDLDSQRQVVTDAQEQATAEISLDLEAGQLTSRLGAWFFDERFDTDIAVECPVCGAGGPANTFLDIRTGLDGKSYGAYFDAGWSFDESWKMNFGARYSWDRRNGFGERESRFGGLIGQPFGFGASDDQSDGLTARLNLEWEPTEDNLFYVQVSRGYRSGGLNLGLDSDPSVGADGVSNIVLGPYDPEFVWTYELGTKSEFFDGDLRINATFFFMDYSDLQVAQPIFGVVKTDNVAEVQNLGIELEGHYYPIPDLRFDYTLSWQHARVKRGLASDPIQTVTGVVSRDLLQDLSGNRLPNAPDLTIKLGIEYAFGLGRVGTLTPRFQYFWQDETYYRVFNTDLDLDDSNQILDAKLTWQVADGPIRLVVFANNLLDEDVIRRLTPIIGFGLPGNTPPQLQRQSTAPRTYGASIRVTF
ncbi:MAG: TonB-dependent receptor [Myxococcota bacterium]